MIILIVLLYLWTIFVYSSNEIGSNTLNNSIPLHNEVINSDNVMYKLLTESILLMLDIQIKQIDEFDMKASCK